MAYRLICLADLVEPVIPVPQIRSSAFLHQVDIAVTNVGPGFIDIRGDEERITDFLVAIRHKDFTYRPSQDGDKDDDI